MKLHQLLFFGVMLMCLCLTLSACVVQVDSKKSGYKEKSYEELLKEYKDDFDTNVIKQKKYEKVMIAIDLCKQYGVKNKMLSDGLIEALCNDLKDKKSNSDVAKYLGIEDDGLDSYEYRFDYYYSPESKSLFTLIRKIKFNSVLYSYSINILNSGIVSSVSFDYNFHKNKNVDDSLWFHVIRHKQYAYNFYFGGYFYPYIGLSDYFRKMDNHNLVNEDFNFKDLEHFLNLKNAGTYEYDIYFNFDVIESQDEVFNVIVSIDNKDKFESYRDIDYLYDVKFRMKQHSKNIQLLSFEKLFTHS